MCIFFCLFTVSGKVHIYNPLTQFNRVLLIYDILNIFPHLLFSESVAFHWGPKPGLIRYYFQEGNRPNTKMDTMSFGFITPLENAILLRIDSQSNNDYLEFEIVSFFKMHFYKLGMSFDFQCSI